LSIHKSLLFSFAEKYTVLVLGFVSSVVLSRLLTPTEVGVYSIGAVVVAVLQIVRDFGVGQYLIKERELTPEKIRAAFSLTLMIAWVIGGLLALLSGPVSDFYREPGVGQVLRVLALNCLLIPFGSITLPVLRREMRFGAIYTINVTSAVVSLVASIGLVLAGFSFMALAWSSVIGVLVSVSVSMFFRPAYMPWLPSLKGVRELLPFGAYATGSNVLDEMAVGAPDMMIGRLIGMESVALYSKGQSLVTLFNMLITRAVTSVVQPMFASQVRSGTDMKPVYLRLLSYMAGFAWPFFAVLAVLADPMVRLLFGSQWGASVPIARILCVSAAVLCLFGMALDLFVVMGHVAKRARVESVALFLRVAGILVAAPFGLAAVAVSIALANLAKAGLIYYGLAELTGLRFGDLCRSLLKSLNLAALSVLPPLLALAVPQLRQGPPAMLVGVAGAGALAAWLVGVVVLQHELKPNLLAATGHLARRLRGQGR
jgi:O-antigen/teichoic acid export membrane protein